MRNAILVLTFLAVFSAGCATGMDEAGVAGSGGGANPTGGSGGGLGGGNDVPPTSGPPIVVPPQSYEHWVWVAVPEMRCADNSPAGLFVNFTKRSDDLLIFFQG